MNKLFLNSRAMVFAACAVFSSFTWVTPASATSQFSGQVISSEVISPAELQQLLAPIALYPDVILSHVLIAATYPLEVVQAHRWSQQNTRLAPEDAVNAAELEGWDPSVAALVAFPELLERMSLDLDWTQSLGDAFLADQKSVLQQVQYLREKAYVQGNLQRMEHVTVVRERSVIYIEPAHNHLIYLPYYDTSWAFGHWWWPKHPPVFWAAPKHRAGHRVGFFWGTGLRVSAALFFTAPRWHEHRIVITDRYVPGGRHRFERARQLAEYRDARYWQHQVQHRRNIRYKYAAVSKRYEHQHGSVKHRDHRDRPAAHNKSGGEYRDRKPPSQHEQRQDHRQDHRQEHRQEQRQDKKHAVISGQHRSPRPDSGTRQAEAKVRHQKPRETHPVAQQRSTTPDESDEQRKSRFVAKESRGETKPAEARQERTQHQSLEKNRVSRFSSGDKSRPSRERSDNRDSQRTSHQERRNANREDRR